MIGTLRANRIAPLALLALAVAASVASVRLASLGAPSFPVFDRLNAPIAPEGSGPAQVPNNVESQATEPAAGPALTSAPFLAPQAPATAPTYGEPAVVGTESGSPSTVTSPGAPTTGNVSPLKPSRFADAEPMTGPASPLRAAPAQTSPKQPRPGIGN